jgi:HD-like signal output (HDOD) protein
MSSVATAVQRRAQGSLAPEASELTEALKAAMSAEKYRPPLLPQVALDVMHLAGKPDVELAEVVTLLERDPMLAARVLASAQSAHYSRRTPVVTLRQAAVRLGMETLGRLVLQAALELRIFRAPGFEWFAERLNRHATAAAHVTRDICRRTGVPAEQAFTCGLLHDIGLASTLQLVAEKPEWRTTPFPLLAPVLDAVHAEASGLLARRWNLPEPLPSVLDTHHHPDVDGVPQPINAALIVAEQLCWEAGAGLVEPPRDASPTELETPEMPSDAIDSNWASTFARAREIIKLDDQKLAAARVQAFDVIGSLGLGPTGA